MGAKRELKFKSPSFGKRLKGMLSSNIGTLIICIVVSFVWTVIYNLAGTYILNKSDVH